MSNDCGENACVRKLAQDITLSLALKIIPVVHMTN